jgi:glycosyltransferase involved in cell wall biosynthesis
MHVIVMIPAYNEEQSIGEVINKIPKLESHKISILVINDGSTDKTEEISRSLGAIVINNPKNLGLGASLKIGLNEAVSLGADIIVNIDADGQYNAEDIPKLIEPIINKQADLVLANRFSQMNYKMPLIKRWGNRFTSWFVRKLSNTNVQDCQTGFRAISRRLAETLKVLLKGGYTYTQEMIIHAKFNGFEIVEIDTVFNARRYGESRLISNVFSYFSKVIRIIIGTYKDYKPLQFFGVVSTIFIILGLIALGLDSFGRLQGFHLVPFINVTNDPKIILTIFIPLGLAFFFFMFGFVLDTINRTKTAIIQQNAILRKSIDELSKKLEEMKQKQD